MEKILFAFCGVGKTYAAENSKKHIVDNDMMYFDRSAEDFISTYAESIINYYNDDSVDYVLCNIHYDVMQYLINKGFNFGIITPVWENEPAEIETIKEIIFGRFVLRKVQTAQNHKWLEKMKITFDSRTSITNFQPFIDTGNTLYPVSLGKSHLSDFLSSDISEL